MPAYNGNLHGINIVLPSFIRKFPFIISPDVNLHIPHAALYCFLHKIAPFRAIALFSLQQTPKSHILRGSEKESGSGGRVGSGWPNGT